MTYPFNCLAVPVAGNVSPVGIDLDGVNDYGSRGSDLVGNADGKTFTFSVWIYADDTFFYVLSGKNSGNDRFEFRTFSGRMRFVARNAAGSTILSVDAEAALTQNTFQHHLISVDLTNSSNRHWYVDDRATSPTWNTYSNDDIDFTCDAHGIGAEATGGNKLKGRLAGLYLDYTYRDLSVEANRRDFITADGFYVKPPTTGILSLPMDDPTDPYRNDGTGGTITANGTVARSGRGPNQYNPAASTFDGSADNLSTTSISGLSDGKAITLVFTFKRASLGNHMVFDIGGSYFSVGFTSTQINIQGFNSSTVLILAAACTVSPIAVAGRYGTIAISLDLSNPSNRQVLIDGEAAAVSWNTYTNDTFDLTRSDYRVGGQVSGSQYYHGELSDVWFDDAYHADLSGFFDTATGKAKDLGANGELPTGTAPTAYWPLNAADPGRDASGNGNTLTVNSGPYPGGRGPNEYWAGSMQGNGTTQFLKRTSALNGAAASGIFSVVWAIVRNTSAGGRIFHLNDSSTGGEFYIEFGSTGTLAVIGKNSADTTIFNLNKATLSSSGVWEIYHLCIDLSSTSLRHLYKDSAAVGTITWNNYADDAIDFSVDIAAVGGAALSASASDWWPGKIGFFAFYPGQYIDFSQEANRLLTVDAFGYPVYLGERGELPTGIPPALYLNRNFHLGTDSSGNGNNFTPQNGPVDGGSVRGDE